LLRDKEIERIITGIEMPDSVLPLSLEWEIPFVTDYLRHKIDLGNLKIYCRAKYRDLPPERVEGLYMKGGFLATSTWRGNLGLSFGEMGEKLLSSSYYHAWVVATDELVENDMFIPLERESENFLMRYLQKARYIVFGPEPVFAYALAKKRELQLLRLLGVGILNQIPSEMLKERMGETYV
jgi:V/A-type H+-transporting ATPase subunit C